MQGAAHFREPLARERVAAVRSARSLRRHARRARWDTPAARAVAWRRVEHQRQLRVSCHVPATACPAARRTLPRTLALPRQRRLPCTSRGRVQAARPLGASKVRESVQ